MEDLYKIIKIVHFVINIKNYLIIINTYYLQKNEVPT